MRSCTRASSSPRQRRLQTQYDTDNTKKTYDATDNGNKYYCNVIEEGINSYHDVSEEEQKHHMK